MTSRDERSIIRTIHKLRSESVSFSSKRIKTAANIPEDVSCPNIRRFLNRKGYGIDKQEKRAFLRKMTKKRTKFAKNVLKRLKEEFWTEGISF